MLLVIEKDSRFTQKLKKHLRLDGLRNFFVETLADGLFLLNSTPARFVLVNLNGVSSMSEIKQLMSLSRSGDFPVLFIEGFKHTRRAAEKLREAGINTIISLPFKISELTDRIDSLRRDKDLMVGSVIGPPGQEVEIRRKIGAGAMGTVYEGYQRSLDRTVAVKFLAHDIHQRDPDADRRFCNEARAMASLRSPHIVNVFAVGEQDGASYMIMEFIEGPNLEKFMRSRKALKIKEALNITRQILTGLSEAHRRGRVHRDLKPANIMINKDNQAVILDFGLVRDLESQEMTKAGTVLGTPRYISPEQINGVPVDHRSDLYSLGIILFEMLIGHPPFKAEDFVAVLMKHIKEPLPTPEDYGKSLPTRVEALIRKMAEKKPDDRFQSAHEVIEEIDSTITQLSNSNSLDSDASALAAVKAMNPRGGVLIDDKGSLIKRFGEPAPNREHNLFVIKNLLSQIQELAVLGEFQRGRLTMDTGDLLVYPALDGLAGVETENPDLDSKFEGLNIDALERLFGEG